MHALRVPATAKQALPERGRVGRNRHASCVENKAWKEIKQRSRPLEAFKPLPTTVPKGQGKTQAHTDKDIGDALAGNTNSLKPPRSHSKSAAEYCAWSTALKDTNLPILLPKRCEEEQQIIQPLHDERTETVEPWLLVPHTLVRPGSEGGTSVWGCGSLLSRPQRAWRCGVAD